MGQECCSQIAPMGAARGSYRCRGEGGRARIQRVPHALALLADIVDIKHIMLPPSARDFKDIYVVFELMETDLHQVSRRRP